ncbi:MAG: hypothetical protein RMN24_08240, partial [Anaerolineae bacterium]|nr:hypothetical protein [Anaerolineae bacterium]
MSFTVDDFQDLLRLLNRHPEWKAELRRQVLSEELLNLPELVRNLIVAHTRAEKRLERLEDLVEDLIVAHTRAEERLSRLEEAVNGLTAVQRRVEETVRDLAESMRRFETRMQRSEDRLNKVVGRTLEMEYREKAHAFFGRWLRRPRVVS